VSDSRTPHRTTPRRPSAAARAWAREWLRRMLTHGERSTAAQKTVEAKKKPPFVQKDGPKPC
jgi:hypothetical protein